MIGFYYSLILFTPLYSTIIILLTKKYLGYHGIALICVFQYFILNTIFFYLIFFKNIINYSGFLNLGTWFNLGKKIEVDIIFHLDYLSFFMSWLVVFLGFFAILYGYDYCKDEEHGDRVLLLLNIFIFAMLLLFNAYNFLVFMFAWECTGIVSCFLINYWNTKLSALKSSVKSFVINRLGDFGLLFGCYILAYKLDNFDFNTLNQELVKLSTIKLNFYLIQISFIEYFTFFLMLAVITKSAQLGFHSWLPDAMEAPTPASALIHSSAMVVAGIYLMLRLSDLFAFSFYITNFITVLGSLTAVYCGFSACFQVDLKKILAYSTVSHLGIMVGSCGLGVYDLTLIYLLNHSLSKCLLFFCAGIIIVFTLNIQDIRRMGNYNNYLLIVFYAFFISGLSLVGFPYFNGFYTKHLILNYEISKNWVETIYFSSFIFSGLFTLIYVVKSIIYVFFGPKRSYLYIYKKNWLTTCKSFVFKSNQSFLTVSLFIILIYINFLGLDTSQQFFKYSYLQWAINNNLIINFKSYQPYFNSNVQLISVFFFIFFWIIIFFFIFWLLSSKKYSFYRTVVLLYKSLLILNCFYISIYLDCFFYLYVFVF